MKRIHAPRERVCLGAFVRAWICASLCAIALLTTTSNSFALEPPPPRGGPKIKMGFALMASGLVTTGFGAGIYIANENAGKTTCTACAKSSWVLPTVLMGLGGAMFVTGGTVFTLGLIENSRSPAPSASLHLGPLGGSVRVQF